MAYDLGDAVSPSVFIFDATGTPADAGAVVLTVTQPDGTALTPAVSHIATGQYSATFVPTQSGRHSVSWVATGANASAYQDEFNISPPQTSLLLSLGDVKEHLRVDTSAKDNQLRRLIGAATDLIEQRVGPVVRRQIVGEYVDLSNSGRFFNEARRVGNRQFVLRNRPVISVDAIVPAFNASFAYDVTSFAAETATGIVRRLDNGTVYGPLLVTYTAGRTYVPAAIEEAAIIIVQHLWAASGGKMGPAGRGGQDTAVAPGYGFAFPNRAQALLEPYLLTPAVG